MNPIQVLPVYAFILTLLFLGLSARVILYRRANRVGLGDKGDAVLLRRMRAQSNFVEYAPIGILLLLILELQGWPALVLHGLALVLVTGRVFHAYGFSSTPEKMRLRVAGMAMTLIMLAVTALLGLVGSLLF